MQTERMPLSTVKTSIRNRRKRAVKLRLEPWGEEYVVAPGATVQVVARGPSGDTLDVQWEKDSVTVFGWPGSVVHLLRRGVELLASPSERRTAPFLPAGYRMPEWVSDMQSALNG